MLPPPFSAATSTLVSIATGIAEDFRGRVHRVAQFPAIGFRPVNLSQDARQFFSGHSRLRADFGYSLAVALDLNRLPADDDAIQDCLAVVGQVGGAYFHASKIPVLPIASSACWIG